MKTAIVEVLQSGANVTLNVTFDDLKEFGLYLIDTASNEAKERIKSGEDELLLEVNEVMRLLGVKDRSTLWRWQKKGYLVPSKVGKKLLYKQSDIDKILTSKS